MGQQVKPGWGQSDREAGQQARYADRSLTRECHQGQQENTLHRQAECKTANPSDLHAAESCSSGDVHVRPSLILQAAAAILIKAYCAQNPLGLCARFHINNKAYDSAGFDT